MAGACGQSDLSEDEAKKEEKKRARWAGVKQQGNKRSIIKRILGSASLGYSHVCHLMSDLIGELKVCLL